MSSVYSRLVKLSKTYPIIRGMAAYAIIWPTSNLCQQSLLGNEKLDYAQAFRFCVFGTFFVAPTLHMWVKVAGAMWPDMTIKSAISKALMEQISYGPAACVCFFFGMSLLERKSLEEASHEVSTKFVPTYKVGMCVWPVVQTINFSLISERNRVPFVSVCSFLWSSFLAYMKQLEAKNVVKMDHITK